MDARVIVDPDDGLLEPAKWIEMKTHRPVPRPERARERIDELVGPGRAEQLGDRDTVFGEYRR